MKLKVDTIRSDSNGFNSIAAIARDSNELFLDTLELDFSSCTFFEANMAAPLYTVLSHVYNRLNAIIVFGMSEKIEEVLRKNHFLNLFDKPSMTDTKQTTIPFKKFKQQAGEQFSEYLDQYMNGHGIPKMSKALTRRFRQSLFEVFQNAAAHSNSKTGIFVCGQFYPYKHRLDFTISDAGIGIRENVRRYLENPRINSCNAIRWAMEEGNSTRGGPQPGGIGLKLIKDFIVE